MEILGTIGFAAALSIAALGSCLGTWTAGMAAIGAWKKCFVQNKPAPFMIIAFVGMPLSQTIYGMILMNTIIAAPETVSLMMKFGAGFLGGIAIGTSAWLQGKAGAVASDAMAETGQGFANFIMVAGIIETVALFVMVFLMGTMA